MIQYRSAVEGMLNNFTAPDPLIDTTVTISAIQSATYPVFYPVTVRKDSTVNDLNGNYSRIKLASFRIRKE